MGLEVEKIVLETTKAINLFNQYGQKTSILDATSYACRISLGKVALKKYDSGRSSLAPTFSDFIVTLLGKDSQGEREAKDALEGVFAILGGSIGHYMRAVAQGRGAVRLSYLSGLINDSVTGTPLPTVALDYLPKAEADGYLDTGRRAKEASSLNDSLVKNGTLITFYNNRSEFHLSSAGHFLRHYLGTNYQGLLPHTIDVAKSFEASLAQLGEKAPAPLMLEPNEDKLKDLRAKWANRSGLDH